MDLAAFHAGPMLAALQPKASAWVERALGGAPHPAWRELGLGVMWAAFSDAAAREEPDGRIAGVLWVPVERGQGQAVITVPLGGREAPGDLFAVDPVLPLYAGMLMDHGMGVLGDLQMDEIRAGARVRLHLSPIEWMREGGGMERIAEPERAEEPPRICIVDWDSAEARDVLDHAAEIICDDGDHAAAVDRILAAHRRAKLGRKPALMVAA